MRRPALLLALAGALGLAGWLTGGPGAASRTALGLGMAETAVSLAPEGPWRAVALYRAGAYGAAAAAFDAVPGPDAPFNRGNALAMGGRYAAALVAYERAMRADPADGAAARNHALVAALYASLELDVLPVEMTLKDRGGEAVDANTGQGTGRAQGSGDEANALGSGFDTPQMAESGLRRTSRFFDAKHIAATDRWLETLPDRPGEYLRARLAAERKRREEAR